MARRYTASLVASDAATISASHQDMKKGQQWAISSRPTRWPPVRTGRRSLKSSAAQEAQSESE
eukprot:900095-Pleurochrysis_carterae.AAC.2